MPRRVSTAKSKKIEGWHLSIFLHPDMDKDIILALAKEMNVSDVVRKALRDYYENSDKDNTAILKQLKVIEKKIDRLQNVTIDKPQPETKTNKNTEIEQVENLLNDFGKV